MMTRDADLAAAIARHQAGDLDAAEAAYRALIGAAPEDPRPRRMLGLLHLTREEPEAAIGQLSRAAAADPDDPDIQRILGEALFQARRFAEAAGAFRRSLAARPAQAAVWHHLARTLAILGEGEEARACLRRCLHLEPAHAGALRDLADSGATDVVPALRACLARTGLSDRDRIDALFALAVAFDRLGAWDDAFTALAEANAGVRRDLAQRGEVFDAAALRDYVDARIAGHGPWPGGIESDLPVFVVGMPRSGTTLVERILAAHPAVQGIGEGPAIGALAQELERLPQPDPAAIRALAGRHMARLRLLAGSASRVVDKTPDNIFHLGTIATLLPGARIIVCRRDPRDVCLSCHFQGFALPMPYTSDLAACALRVQETGRLLAHWRATLPLRLTEVSYERLIAEPEREARRLIAFLGLDWNPHCLRFHAEPGIVTSASVWQVRRPLYADSVGRWRHYARHLGPVLAAFGAD